MSAPLLPRVQVTSRHGRPVLLHNDTPWFYTSYFIRHVVERDADGRLHPMRDREEYVRQLAALCQPFGERGIHGYEVPVNPGWRGPDDWNPAQPLAELGEPIDDQLRAVTQGDPDARIMLNMVMHPPAAWKEAYPDEYELSDEGDRFNVSIGSDRYVEELLAHVPETIHYVMRSPYAGNVTGLFFSCYHEGFTWTSLVNKVGDFSAAMTQAFRDWLRARYPDETALRAAWRDDDITFDTAAVPTREEQLYSDLGWFRDPTGPRKGFDYMACRTDRYVDLHYRIARTLKAACDERLPVFCFGAYLQVLGWPGHYWFTEPGLEPVEFNPHALSMQTGWRRILDCPDIDGWESPFDYLYRQMGGVCLAEGMDESARLRGKLFIVNEDTRTFLSDPADVYGRVETREETTAVHRRNFSMIATQWSGCNWMEQIRNWLQDDALLAQIDEYDRLLQCAREWPETPLTPIGVFIDEQSIPYEKPLIDLDWGLVYKQRLFGLSHCGVPFRIHLLDDLALDNMPDYRCNIFLNTFYMDTEREALLRKRVLRDGKTAVWMVAPGFCHATDGLSLESMRRLTGIRFAKDDVPWEQWVTISNFTHPITRGLPHDCTYGSSARIGPAFYVNDPEAVVLGRRLHMQGRHEPALVVKEMGGYRSIYSAAPLLPADLLRGIARDAGCHVYAEENDIIVAGRGLVTCHTAVPGPRTIRLPDVATVHDLFTGTCLGENVSEVMLPFDEPGTAVLTMLPPELWRQ
ncbi:MAG: hypothetical protein BWY76_00903 [bacterium ADurb.Bin429]|nr:MAG: hypothetical protein BWY76_00903 [bacterium ADurb.Bin429]